MRILTKDDAKKIDADFIYSRGDVLAITEKDFNRRFDIVPKAKFMGSMQIEAEKLGTFWKCPGCNFLQDSLGICNGCGKVLIKKRNK